MSFINTLNEQFPIRRKEEQKKTFRAWFIQTAQDMGYSVQVEENGGHQNVVVGDPETAQTVFIAHYDTPAASFLPNVMTPRNRLFFWAYQMLQVGILLMLGVAVGVPLAVITGENYFGFLAGYAVYMGLLCLMMFGPANKHNVNDNTSGVAAILELMNRMPEETREKAAFILFDNEEKGCRGSKAYAKAHPAVKADGFIVNLDCVGDGGHMLLMPSKYSRWDGDMLDALNEAFQNEGNIQGHILSQGLVYYPSDHRKFKFHVAVCACRRLAGLGFYIPHLRTRRDTVMDEENIIFLSEGMEKFLELYLNPEK